MCCLYYFNTCYKYLFFHLLFYFCLLYTSIMKQKDLLLLVLQPRIGFTSLLIFLHSALSLHSLLYLCVLIFLKSSSASLIHSLIYLLITIVEFSWGLCIVPSSLLSLIHILPFLVVLLLLLLLP